MRNIKITLEYDGTNYCGWQRQKNAITIQQCIEDSISQITGDNTEVIGCSRTDAGVHARGFVANFFTKSKIPAEKFKYAINSNLPKDIVILTSEEADNNFHARYNCLGKTYSYTILNRKIPSAIDRNYVYHVKNRLNIDYMMEASEYFIGTHDFEAFKSKGSSVKTSIRTINSMEIKNKDHIIKIYVSADGFLYNMVRIIVGTLIDIGENKIEPRDVESIIKSKDRNRAGMVVPSSGLCLEEVFY